MNHIVEHTKRLKLAHIRENYQITIQEAMDLDWSYEQFLEHLLENEVAYRNNNRIQSLIRRAKFPNMNGLETYQTTHFQNNIRKTLNELKTLSFIERKENVILIGNPGVGKTHFATGIGIAACLNGLSVLFISIPNLMIELKEALNQNQLTAYKRKFERYDLVILDEFGYVTFDQQGNEILFNLLSNRTNNGSMIMTTNLVFDRWEEIFKDPVLTGAIVDRIAHKAHVLDMSGPSFRVTETKAWLENK